MKRTSIAVLAVGAVLLGAAAALPAKDRTPPTTPRIVGPSQTESRFPFFSFISRDAVTPRAKLRFRCAVDSTRLRPCPARYNPTLKLGRHVLRVQAVDLAGNKSRIASFVVTVVPSSQPPPIDVAAELARVRAATEKYQNPAVALADGYVARPECVMGTGGPAIGGMGIHYEHPALTADDAIDPLRPEQLLYEPTPTGHVLVGVEYYKRDADQDAGTAPDSPKIFGIGFDGPMPGHYAGQPVHYDLHVWLYRENPVGIFNAFNTNVRCP
jgi:hypothetical protein